MEVASSLPKQVLGSFVLKPAPNEREREREDEEEDSFEEVL